MARRRRAAANESVGAAAAAQSGTISGGTINTTRTAEQLGSNAIFTAVVATFSAAAAIISKTAPIRNAAAVRSADRRGERSMSIRLYLVVVAAVITEIVVVRMFAVVRCGAFNNVLVSA